MSSRRSPLPQRDGLDPVWVRTPARVRNEPLPWATVAEFLRERLPAVNIDDWLKNHRFVDETGHPLTGQEPCQPARFIWFHKDPPPPERPVPGELTILHHDERIIVMDKPHFLATTPRGSHIRETALIRARLTLGLPHIAPAHRLDRLTGGILLFTTEPRWRRPYQTLFETGAVTKTYEALAVPLAGAGEGFEVRSRIIKPRGSWQAIEVEGEPNAHTRGRLLQTSTGPGGQVGRYELCPVTGKTHQLRVHMSSLGAPLLNDPLYPVVQEELLTPAGERFDQPLGLVARTLRFIDPVDGTPRSYTSGIQLSLPSRDL
ncbi:pseudouridine synthase [Dermatophilus congolensis]|uniref:RNA pseudouridylate synthase n=1 Tax=Dermatophilus congolensis TaxID=1863 RepID=A0A239V5D8_9MICO|nr:pseudouridine synthase [Dermatophilus congolensis]MBO3130234.1 pseudouridylate synthase [Dermatophilus congolensis]MBO3131137.1 pseudouridylate synthase [Dermatophilus congolensis]MBO3134705.1 pseudouridylate synthase [Dermatophilus congolensis]MBO3136940.1 pseudouridylate synthase [Dermatophilus congolensis]MBO3139186.1 pseudouridylate synthase [Dermatophilus congolensis]